VLVDQPQLLRDLWTRVERGRKVRIQVTSRVLDARGSNNHGVTFVVYHRRIPNASVWKMRPEDEARMAELLKLIARERDPRRVLILAKELEQLLASEPAPPEEPRGS